MKQDTTTPLYKVLNEKRLKGDWIAYPKGITNKEYGVSVFFDYGIESDTDTKYTALAVNNLAPIAEALELIIKRIDDNWELITSGTQNGIKTALLSEAKEALKRIS